MNQPLEMSFINYLHWGSLNHQKYACEQYGIQAPFEQTSSFKFETLKLLPNSSVAAVVVAGMAVLVASFPAAVMVVAQVLVVEGNYLDRVTDKSWLLLTETTHLMENTQRLLGASPLHLIAVFGAEVLRAALKSSSVKFQVN